MKKILVALAVMAAAGVASAADITVTGGRNVGGEYSVGGVSVGTPVGPVRGELTLNHSFTKGREETSFGVGATYPLTTVAGVALAAKADAAYLVTPGAAANGFTVGAGVEASYPLTKTVSLVGTAEHVFAQDKIHGASGNQVTVGVRTSF